MIESIPKIALVVALLVVVFNLGIPVALNLWARRVARRRSSNLWRYARYLPLLGLAGFLIGAALSVVGLIDVFGVVAGTAPEQKAAVLQDGIGSAMAPTFLLTPICYLVYGLSAVTSLIGSLTVKTH